MAKTKKTKEAVNIILELNGKEYLSAGDSVDEALSEIKPDKFTTKGNLKVFMVDKTASILLNIVQMRKLFGTAGPTTQKIFMGFISKRISQLLK